MVAEAVYALCAVLSAACALLLWLGFRRSRARLLLWSSLCFACLAANNVILFLDMIVFPSADLSLSRTVLALAGLLLLLFGLIWDAE